MRLPPCWLQTEVVDLLCEFLAFDGVVLTPSYYANEVLCQDKRHTLPVDAKLLLAMVEEVAKIYVEHLH